MFAYCCGNNTHCCCDALNLQSLATTANFASSNFFMKKKLRRKFTICSSSICLFNTTSARMGRTNVSIQLSKYAVAARTYLLKVVFQLITSDRQWRHYTDLNKNCKHCKFIFISVEAYDTAGLEFVLLVRHISTCTTGGIPYFGHTILL